MTATATGYYSVYPRDKQDPQNKDIKILKDGKWIRLPPVLRFNPNYKIFLDFRQLDPIWFYEFIDFSGLYVVEIKGGILYFYKDPPQYPRQPLTTTPVEVFNSQTLLYLMDQALLQHGHLRNLCLNIEGKKGKFAYRMAEECHVLFLRSVYQRAVLMGVDPFTTTLRDFEPHRRWLKQLPNCLGQTLLGQ